MTRLNRYYHKATVAGTINLMGDYQPGWLLCCSTEKTRNLFWRTVTLVIDTDLEPKEESHFDIDSKLSTYNEARIAVTEDMLRESVKYIIIPGKMLTYLKKGTFSFNGTQPFAKELFRDFEYDIKAFCKWYFGQEGYKTYYPNAKLVSQKQAEKINKKWTLDFLNIN
jgi:hypothetical protein